MSSLKKLIGFLLTVNLLWSGAAYLYDSLRVVECDKPYVKPQIDEQETFYINGVKCYRPKKKT